jgi:hypothetical protein
MIAALIGLAFCAIGRLAAGLVAAMIYTMRERGRFS